MPQTKPSVKQQLTDHLMVWLVNNPDHAVRLNKVREKLRAWLR